MLNEGKGTIFRPLFFEFFKDPACLDNAYIDNFFMIGSSLLVVPNLHDDNSMSQTTTPAYFPFGDWFDLRDNSRVPKRDYKPQLVNVQTTLNEMPAVYLRSGKTIFTNDIEHVKNSNDLENNYNILISLQKDQTGTMNSSGILPALIDYDSKPDVTSCIKNHCYVNIITTVQAVTNNSNKIKIVFSKANFYSPDYTSMKINKFVIYGIKINSRVAISSSNLDSIIGKGKFEIEYVNDYCFIVKLKANLNIKKEDVDILLNISTS
jgi:alpha-glucosidase (family GH31 glycosyl hydrolase)